MKRLKIEGEEIKAREEDVFQRFCTIGGFNASNLHFKTNLSIAATRLLSFSVKIEQKQSLKQMKRTSKVQRGQTVSGQHFCARIICAIVSLTPRVRSLSRQLQKVSLYGEKKGACVHLRSGPRPSLGSALQSALQIHKCMTAAL